MAKTKIPKGNETLLLALACGASQETAAQKAGVSRRTVVRRLEDPAFRKQLNAIRVDIVQRLTGTLTAGALEAAKTLLALLASSVPPSTRLGAAKTIIELGAKLREETDLAERLRDLEEQMAKHGQKH